MHVASVVCFVATVALCYISSSDAQSCDCNSFKTCVQTKMRTKMQDKTQCKDQCKAKLGSLRSAFDTCHDSSKREARIAERQERVSCFAQEVCEASQDGNADDLFDDDDDDLDFGRRGRGGKGKGKGFGRRNRGGGRGGGKGKGRGRGLGRALKLLDGLSDAQKQEVLAFKQCMRDECRKGGNRGQGRRSGGKRQIMEECETQTGCDISMTPSIRMQVRESCPRRGGKGSSSNLDDRMTRMKQKCSCLRGSLGLDTSVCDDLSSFQRGRGRRGGRGDRNTRSVNEFDQEFEFYE